ncbi:hypothetical protein SKAU_G00057000 [Synaphobranchus kaupii]|uniref:B30.2/SPRY domain-containing protein n=1 Tax=Synaphobranchus kaupii TaxID=118154 RepID=A0A9Q1JAC5_SYNKA|nr:hypothetical protein SKAU_G00057000 [Synaphobranchus kaupii]
MKQTSIKAEVSKAKTELEGMFDLAKESVAEQHRELQELIDQNMQQAFLLIQAMKESMLQDMEQLVRVGEEYQEKSKHIQDIVEQLKRSQNTDYATIISISGDKTKMQYRVSADSNKSHKRKQRETTVNVLASQSFTEGSHYWEVNAKNIERWTVGVVEQGWVKKGVQQALGQDRLSWALQMDGDSLVALHNDDTIMIREAVIERLGIFLDFKKGRLQFFNVNSGSVLHTFVVGENITFDDSIPLPHLKISGGQDQDAIQSFSSLQQKPQRKQRETTVNVLASQSFTEGSHYWEVNAKNIERWTVGVVEQGWVKKGVQQALGQDRLSMGAADGWGFASGLCTTMTPS